MSVIKKTTITAVLLAACLVLFQAAAFAGDYPALQGVNAAKAVFDVRTGNVQSALIHLQLVHQTFKNQALAALPGKPAFAVVFMDVTPRLLSKNRSAFSPDEKKMLEEMDLVIGKMIADGIRVEVCQVAVNFFGVDPKSISPGIAQVPNGWVSSIGYQQQGYALVPIY